MAKYKGQLISEKHLKASIAAKHEIHEDFDGAGAVENRNSYM